LNRNVQKQIYEDEKKFDVKNLSYQQLEDINSINDNNTFEETSTNNASYMSNNNYSNVIIIKVEIYYILILLKKWK